MMTPMAGLAALVVSALVVAACAVVQARNARRGEGRLERRMATMEAAWRAYCAAQARLGDRLIDVECESRRIADTVSRLDLRAPGGGAYRQAETLAARGVGSEELVETCGIGREEAALLGLLHRKGEREQPEDGAVEVVH